MNKTTFNMARRPQSTARVMLYATLWSGIVIAALIVVSVALGAG
jgi:hypothetical protein